ncbi:hypothetical protein BJX76DRAFT_144262 [Aspergillus varians]
MYISYHVYSYFYSPLFFILGPSAEAVLTALAQRETACLDKFPHFPRDTQQGLFNGPGGYHPSKKAKASVLQDFLKISPHILPKTNLHVLRSSGTMTSTQTTSLSTVKTRLCFLYYGKLCFHSIYLTVSYPVGQALSLTLAYLIENWIHAFCALA